MVTTKRNTAVYGENASNGITLIKERNVSSFEEFMGANANTENNETLSEARVRMQKKSWKIIKLW